MNNFSSSISYDGGMGDGYWPQRQQQSEFGNYFGDYAHGYHDANDNIPCSQPSSSTANTMDTYPMPTPEQMEQQTGAWKQNVLVQNINVAQACTNNVDRNAMPAPSSRGRGGRSRRSSYNRAASREPPPAPRIGTLGPKSLLLSSQIAAAATASSFAASSALEEYNHVSELDLKACFYSFRMLTSNLYECETRQLRTEKEAIGNDLSAKVQEMEEQTKRHKEEIAVEKENFAKLKKMDQKMENQLRAEINARDQTIQEKDSEIENLMKSVAEAESREQDMLMEFKRLNDELVAKEKRWNHDNVDKDNELKQMSQARMEWKEKYNSAQNTADNFEIKISLLQDEKCELEQRVKELTDLIEAKNSKIGMVCKRRIALRKQNRKKNSTIKQQAAEIDELISENAKLKEEIEGLQANLEKKGELLRRVQEVCRAQASLYAHHTEINEMVQEIETAMESSMELSLSVQIQLSSAQDNGSSEDAPPHSPLTEQQFEKTMQADEGNNSNNIISQEVEDDEGQCETERMDGPSRKKNQFESGSGSAEEKDMESEASQNLNSFTDSINNGEGTEEEANNSPEGENLGDKMEHEPASHGKIAKCGKGEEVENGESAQQLKAIQQNGDGGNAVADQEPEPPRLRPSIRIKLPKYTFYNLRKY